MNLKKSLQKSFFKIKESADDAEIKKLVATKNEGNKCAEQDTGLYNIANKALKLSKCSV